MTLKCRNCVYPFDTLFLNIFIECKMLSSFCVSNRMKTQEENFVVYTLLFPFVTSTWWSKITSFFIPFLFEDLSLASLKSRYFSNKFCLLLRMSCPFVPHWVSYAHVVDKSFSTWKILVFSYFLLKCLSGHTVLIISFWTLLMDLLLLSLFCVFSLFLPVAQTEQILLICLPAYCQWLFSVISASLLSPSSNKVLFLLLDIF